LAIRYLFAGWWVALIDRGLEMPDALLTATSTDFGAAAVLLLLIKRAGRSSAATFGLRTHHLSRQIVFGLGAGMALILPILLV
jgi:hypothetical protein